jgi:trehalose synthase-fused probable maltokinase
MGTLDRALTGALADWLPRQRWFARKDRAITEVAVASDTGLAAGGAPGAGGTAPELRHVVLDVRQGEDTDRYQLLVGVREGELPDRVQAGVIGTTPDGAHLYDAVHDPGLTRVLLEGIAEETEIGPLRFHRAPGAEIERGLTGIPVSAEQSNTSLIYGDAYICKLFRRLSPGVSPDLEVNLALTQAGCAHVAAVKGWIELAPGSGGEPVTLALLSEYLRTATDGWQLAITSVRDWLAHPDPDGHGRYPGGGPDSGAFRDPGGRRRPNGRDASTTDKPSPVLDAGSAGGDFAAEAERLGAATAAVHRDLAVAFGVTMAPAGEVRAMAERMHRQLAEVSRTVPELDRYAAAISRAFDDLAESARELPLQRVHGDYHLGQAMRTDKGWVLLDFEGEPARPYAERRAMAHPLRDVAGMLRSFEYAARFLPSGDTSLAEETANALELRAQAWADRNRDAFCRGYAEAGGADPAANAVLVRALELDKLVYEIRYEAQNRPSWLPVPLRSLAHFASDAGGRGGA